MNGAVATHIHRAQPDDWPRVRAIRLRALEEAPDAFSSTWQREHAWAPGIWQDRLSATDVATFIATSTATDEDAGMVVGAPYDGRPGTAGLFGMWVAPEARGRGVGDALVEAMVDWARAMAFTSVLLEVADANHIAIALYARHGFTRNGNRSTLPPPREHIAEHERELRL